MNLLITAGPTREPIDPVRYISNRSSGKMGYALAIEARRRGHAVTLISGPVSLPVPEGVRRVSVMTAADMLQAVSEYFPGCEALIMTAAVADWRPCQVEKDKIKKRQASMTLALEPTRDILKTIRPLKGHRVVVGFAAETRDLLPEAQRKMREKGLDLMVANDVSRPDAGFEVDTNQVVFVTPDGRIQEWPLMSKQDVARHILDWLEVFRV